MEKKKQETGDAMGRLPALAPLANPYIPYQMEGSTQYETRKALVRGTLYPGLDLPFLGMVNKKPLPVTPLSEMQVLEFAIQELALYLDTHRDDLEALELYRKYQLALKKLREEYERSIGPMTHTGITESNSYQWLQDPWPWEYCVNKEV